MVDSVVLIENVSKYYKLYGDSKNRLKEALHPFGKKYHEDFYALEKINLKINKGDILGIVGKNGSGKSTLLKIISGVLQPNTGSVRTQGNIAALLELGSGFNPDFTGMQNIYFYGTILGLTKVEIKSKIDSIVEFSDIGGFINQPLKSYSSGMKARLGFAVAININPDILILDEVLAVGDALFQRKCFAKMEELFDSGKTIIFVSHNPQSIIQLCNRAILLHEKHIICDDEPKKVIDWYNKIIFSGKNGAEGLKVPAKQLESNEQYLESLKCDPQIISNADVMIDEIEVTGVSDDSKLNILKCGKVYRLKLSIAVNEKLYGCRVAFVIKDKKGLGIGGARIEDFDCLEEGSRVKVSKNFYCNFKPDHYFITISLISITDKQVYYRAHDAFVFKIETWPDNGYWGLTYIGSDEVCCE